jgi:hypothetical protein
MTEYVFSVQDETGTVYQVTTLASPTALVAVGDTGTFTGTPDEGTDGFSPPPSETVNFTVSQVLDAEHFSIKTLTEATANWPRSGVMTWATGANTGAQTTITEIDPANAYIDIPTFQKYHATRGNTIPASATTSTMQAAIVKATDYLDTRYRYKGVKLVQQIGTDLNDANVVFLEPWLTPWGLNTQFSIMTPSITPQHTEWPRQGVTDLNGDTINGIPVPIKQACAELALRVLNGVNLQPDYDTSIVTAGGVLQSSTQEVGPIKVTKVYDTKLGIGFFADFPQITRLLSTKGLLVPNKGRVVMR